MYVYSVWLMCQPNAIMMSSTVVREVVCTECHCFASFETVRIHTGVTVAILKACLSYSGTLDSCFLQAG